MNRKIALGTFLLIFLSIFVFEIRDDRYETAQTKPKLTVVLTFDYEDLDTRDGEKNLPAIFGVLDKHNASATFFILGSTAHRRPESVREIYARGYSLGLHTYYHQFPIFEQKYAEKIARIYGSNASDIWKASFKTPEKFYSDLIRSRWAIMNAVDNATVPKIFRSPSLVINWTLDERYSEVLKQAGVKIDSSVYQDFSNPRTHYNVHGITEVPVTASEARLDNMQVLYSLAEKSSEAKIPLVLFLHPNKLTEERMEKLDKFLAGLENKYDVAYLKLEDVIL